MSDIAPDRFIDNVFAYQKTAAINAWTARELDDMGRAAGFSDTKVQPLPPSPQTMIVLR